MAKASAFNGYIISDQPQISVIIVNYNGAKWLTRCVASVQAQTLENFECFIVDNGSTDGSLAQLRKDIADLDDRFQILDLGENTGFATGNNIAARQARGDWLACLNPDAFARPDWLAEIMNATQLVDNVTMVGSLQYMALEPDILDGAGDCYHISGLAWRAKHGHPALPTPRTAEVFGPCGAGSAYHRETFMKHGGFDERFFCYHEDVDLAFRLRLAGGKCIQSADAIIDHVSSGISGKASDFAIYHGTRNRVWTFFKNMPGPALILLTPLHLALNFAFLLWAVFRSGHVRPTARGIWHGFKGLGPILASRRAVKQHRTVSTWDALMMMCWDPRIFKRRDLHRVSNRQFPDKGHP